MAGIFSLDQEETVVDTELEGARSGLDRHKVSDAIYQQMQEERLDFGFASDGLPMPLVRSKLPLAPTLHQDTLVCMGDTSKFVIRDDWGTVVVELDPSLVERTPSGRYRIQTQELVKLGLCEKFNVPVTSKMMDKVYWDLATEIFRHCHVVADEKWVEVTPIREQCKHYARQMTDFGDDLEHKFMERLCTARRDSGGEFLSLRDNRMYACELREPIHIQSTEAALDSFDNEKVKLGLERTKAEETFDVDSALSEQ